MATIQQTPPGLTIEVVALALRIRSEGSALVRPFLPLQAQPTQILDQGVIKVRLRAVGIEILVAQDQGPSGGLRTLLGDPEGTCMAQV